MANLELVKKLREETGLSIGDINKALAEAGDDEVKARELLRERGAALADKKSTREIKQGAVAAYIHNHRVGAMVTLGSETDFVARNPEFLTLANDLAMQIAAMQPKDLAELLSQPFIKDESLTINELLNRHIAKLGENIRIEEFVRFTI